jgi:hypothetical protein
VTASTAEIFANSDIKFLLKVPITIMRFAAPVLDVVNSRGSRGRARRAFLFPPQAGMDPAPWHLPAPETRAPCRQTGGFVFPGRPSERPRNINKFHPKSFLRVSIGLVVRRTQRFGPG